MTTLSDRLRGVIRAGLVGRQRRPATRVEERTRPSADDDTVADVLDGEWHERGGQRFLVVDRMYVPGYRHGSMALADSLPPSDGVWPRLSLLTDPALSMARTLAPAPLRGFGAAGAPSHLVPSPLLFIDLETTGIAGGAGTYAFLVGCGWFAGGTFRTRQFFLSSFTAERALLEAVGELAANAGTVVSYNGKSFDLPLIETRFALHRLQSPFGGLPHLDMLHPARRMWRVESRKAT